MEDQQIIELFFQRSESALTALEEKYGNRALQLAHHFLRSRRDAEECVSDALLTLWERIPPEQPTHLWAYFSRVVRNLSCSRLDHLLADRRDPRREIPLSQLEGCLPHLQDTEQLLEAQRISQAINSFLDRQDSINRIIFVRRFYYFDSCADIAKRVGLTRGAVNTRLSRLRDALREVLEKEEIGV